MKVEELKPRIENPTEASVVPVTKGGTFPDGAYLTTNLIEFFRHDGEWVLPKQPRMDGVVRAGADGLAITEPNKLKEGEGVVFGDTEDGSQGIFVISFPQRAEEGAQFGFMSSTVSRERRVDYPKLAAVLNEARESEGKIVWVLGPAVVHAGGIGQMEWLVRNRFVGALLGGNAIGAHDIEHAMFGTSLGMQDNLRLVHNAHRMHLEALNTVRRLGSIKAAVEAGAVTRGIMYECVRNQIPYVLTASIRDDGPLPDVIVNNLEGQKAMRAQTIDANLVVMLASVLHSVATGNMTPTYRVDGEEVKSIPVIAVDSDEFAVTKLVDRGTGQAFPVIANATDFLQRLVEELSK